MRKYSQTISMNSNWWLEDQLNYTQLLEALLDLSMQHDQQLQESLSPYIIAEGQSWIIIQTYLEQLQELNSEKPLVLTTSIQSCHRYFVTREYTVHQADELKIRVRIQFAGFDLESRRMTQLNLSAANIETIVESKRPYRFPRLPRSLDEEEIETIEFTAQAEAIDDNQHVNNLIYWRWYTQALTADWLRDHQIETIHIKYNRELYQEDKIQIQTHYQALTTQQQLIRCHDQQVASQALIQWRNK